MRNKLIITRLKETSDIYSHLGVMCSDATAPFYIAITKLKIKKGNVTIER